MTLSILICIAGAISLLYAWGWFCVFKLPDFWGALVYWAPFVLFMGVSIHYGAVVPAYNKAKAKQLAPVVAESTKK
jgi:hypothetical protein